jgi:hypothetical protein
MTIEIHRPELAALITERMRNGGFQTIEDTLMQALETAPIPETSPATAKETYRCGFDCGHPTVSLPGT